MSARAASLSAISLPRGLFKSSARLFLFRFSTAKQYDSPFTCGSKRRDVSPSGKLSIFTTSAPMSPSTIVQYGPAITFVRSRTRTPSRGSAIPSILSNDDQLSQFHFDANALAHFEHFLRPRRDAQARPGAVDLDLVVPVFAEIGAKRNTALHRAAPVAGGRLAREAQALRPHRDEHR